FHEAMYQCVLVIQDLGFLIFNTSFIPMMVMSIIACQKAQTFTNESVTKYYMMLIALAGNTPSLLVDAELMFF
ncbi:hypothetical protein AAVH_40826, partial [Aphelenchoides avenae]